MANDNNIKKINAADIERYHKGLLSSKEMHVIEKAALDDPFLADALEGYAITGVNVDTDIADLKSRLQKRTEEENKVLPVIHGKTSSFSWWKVAAMVILIAGAGLLVYQLGFNKKSNDIAEISSFKKEKAEIKDLDSAALPTPPNTDSNSKYVMPENQQNEISAIESDKKDSPALKQQTPKKNELPKTLQYNKEPRGEPDVSAPQPGITQEKIREDAINDDNQKKISSAKQEEVKARQQKNEPAPSGNIALEYKKTNAEKSIAKPVQANRGFYNRSNVFRGRVTDSYNNALPFSNITNIEDSIGTYSDARGYFTLTSPDSVLNVQVKSLGFESNNVQLQDNAPNNNILLQEDRSSLSEVVISNKKPNSTRAKDNNMVLEEPEPADGWSNYDMYLANNLKTPDVFKDKQAGTAGEVELSFDVDKNGEPVNISVKKSLCESCDKEAIRLIKEGPKWKRKTKKGKATVKVSF